MSAISVAIFAMFSFDYAGAKLAAMAMIANLTGIDGMDQIWIFTAHALGAWLGGRSW